MGQKRKPKLRPPRKLLYAKPVFPPNWPKDANGQPMFSALWPKDENGEFKVVAVTDTGWSAEGPGPAFGPRQLESAEDDFRADFGVVTLELDFEFASVDEIDE